MTDTTYVVVDRARPEGRYGKATLQTVHKHSCRDARDPEHKRAWPRRVVSAEEAAARPDWHRCHRCGGDR